MTAQPSQELLWRHRNLGKALFENPATITKAPEELKKAVDLAPRSFRDRVNYGMALLRAGLVEESVAELKMAQSLDAAAPHTYFNLGIAYKRLGRVAEATAEFERMLKLVPDDAVSHYNLGFLHTQAGRRDQALGEFQRAAQLDPHMVAPRFAIYNHYRLAGESESAAKALAVFREAKQRQRSSGESEDVEWSFYAELYDPAQPQPTIDEPRVAPRFERKTLAGAAAAGLLVFDADGDGRPDLLAWSKTGVLVFRRGAEPMAATGLERLKDVVHVAAGDFDNDGLADLCVVTSAGATLYRNAGGRFEQRPLPAAAGRFTRAVWMDFDHDYDLDLFLLGDRGVLLRNTGAAFEDSTKRFPFAAGTAKEALALRPAPDARGVDLAVSYADGRNVLYRDRLVGQFEAAPLARMPEAPVVEADFDGDGRADRAGIAADGSIYVLMNRTEGTGAWLAVSLAGVKNLKMAPHAEIEIRAGSLYRHKTYAGVPAVFELGNRRVVDAVRITWPNGMIQNETNVRVNQTLAVKEAPRLAGSCPMVYTWNGRAFEFITDVLGVAPLGASSGDGQYFPVDHDEYVSIRGESLQPRNGFYEIRVAEELHEVAYLDQVRLIAVDHDASVDILTNEKFKSPPFPEFRLFGVRNRLFPVAARDHRGRDVRPALLAADHVYPAGFAHNAAGVAELHTLTLDFGVNAARGNRAVLFLEGWVDWADGSTFLGAAQSQPGLVFPYLQVKDAQGQWKTVVDDMGIPAGKPKTIAVDLTSRFLSASREVRIVTNLCLYWDRIYLSEDSAAPTVRMTGLDAAGADLGLRGFSHAIIDATREQPERFEYARWNPNAAWNQTAGNYTRYGDVRALTLAADDRMIVMGSGDELRLRFPANLPPLAPGQRRDFLLLVDGWAKDSDANTAYSQTVEPLPFHAMSRYPYPAGERFPDDEAHRVYRAEYNTRPAIRYLSRMHRGIIPH